ncbi:MAG: 16S rRNA (cytidine(1402)-2'-O)-methyltransferase [Actinobacteria bacterium]|nr:16S rRNA (cytidine(1402)-2'-O)-methyltransferase [Actinomycetota bacterium]
MGMSWNLDSMSEFEEGKLFLVSTPIGNLSDLSERAIETLKTADLIACEDTRRTGQLLQLVGIQKKKLIRVDAHTEFKKKDKIVSQIKEGCRVALVSDAGTPGISDPGEHLVREVIENGLKVSVVPGASAPLVALVASGLSMKRWVMEGFLPRKGKDREYLLENLASEERTIILFESAKRLPETLNDLCRHLGGQRLIAVARELTKIHEEVWRGSLQAASEHYTYSPKGEVVVVIEGFNEKVVVADELIIETLRKAKDSGLSARDAAKQVSIELGIPRGKAYSFYTDLD